MELDDWEKYEENWEKPGEETNSVFPVKKQSIEETKLKEEIERTNQQTVNDLFKVKSTGTTISNTTSTFNTIINMKTKLDYTNYAKECSNKMKSNKATSQNILVFCKTIVDENCLRISAEHLEDLLEYIHKIKESKSFKPIAQVNNNNQIKIKQQNHKEIFGDCTDEFDEEHLRIESNYSR